MRRSSPFYLKIFYSFIIVILFIGGADNLTSKSVCVFAATDPYSSAEIEREIGRLDAVADALAKLHQQLTINEQQMVELNQRALKNFQCNLMKVYIKGGMDVWNKASMSVGAAADLLAEVLLNLYLEPLIYIPQKDQVVLLSLSKEAAKKNQKLKSLYQAIGEVMAADAARFDDDLTPLRYTAPWWKTPDGKKDTQSELVTRKTNIIIKLSDIVYQATIKEKARIRDERRIILQYIKNLKADLVQKKEEEKIQQETKDWHDRLRQRQEKQKFIPASNDRGESMNQVDRQPAIVWTPEQRAAQEKAQRERKEAYRKKAEALKVMKAKESRATVYIPSEIPRHYVVGDRVVFSALIDPPEVRGKLEWFLDDRRIGTGPNITYVFNKPGMFDLSVILNIRFKFQDKYLDQIYVEDAPETVDSGPPLYPAELEGKKTQAMDLPYCKYWILHKNNKVYVTGHYYTLTGKKIEYTSEAIKNYMPTVPVAGMFALKSGNGYHIYQTYGARSPQVKYVIAKMTSSGVSVVNRLDVTRLEIKISPDLTSATVIYQTESDSADRKILLK